ncbi:MAG: phage holin family protein [Rhodoferax sp.]|nr:phage holin family protein [Rhodoferax sp.]
MSTSAGRPGLFSSLKLTAGTFLAIGQTRLELLANELEVQKLQLLRMLLLAQALLFCAAVGLVLLVALAALLWWEQRIVVVGVAAALFVAATTWCARTLMGLVNAPEPAFAATLAELRQDVQNLKAASRHANPTD